MRGFFIPVFFVGIGLEANFNSLFQVSGIALTVVVTLIAVISKIIGCMAGAWAGRLKRSESFLVGVGMISRGEVALVIVSLGLSQGFIDNKIFSIVIFMTVFTTLMTPLLLKIVYSIFEGRSQTVAVPKPAATVVTAAADDRLELSA